MRVRKSLALAVKVIASAGLLSLAVRDIDWAAAGTALRDLNLTWVLLAPVVMLFMVLYYRLPGLLASGALLIYTIISLAVFKLIPVTMTLAGIGAFVLSIGMAVDANVLIYERMREEIHALSMKTLTPAEHAAQGAALHHLDGGPLIPAAGDDDEGHGGSVALEPRDEVGSLGIRQLQVEHHGVRFSGSLANHRERRVRVGRLDDVASMLPEGLGNRPAHERLIVHHQHARRGFLPDVGIFPTRNRHRRWREIGD